MVEVRHGVHAGCVHLPLVVERLDSSDTSDVVALFGAQSGGFFVISTLSEDSHFSRSSTVIQSEEKEGVLFVDRGNFSTDGNVASGNRVNVERAACRGVGERLGELFEGDGDDVAGSGGFLGAPLGVECESSFVVCVSRS